MLYLILSVLSASLMMVMMRYFEEKISDRYVMFLGNYIVCLLLARVYMGGSPIFPKTESLRFTLICGFFAGVMLLVSLAISQWNFATSGIILGSTFSKLGVLVPTLTAVLFFGERPKTVQIAGFILAIASIFIINSDGGSGNLTEEGRKKDPKLLKLMLFANLIASGLTSTMSNIFDKLGDSSMKNNYLFFNFVFAIIATLAVIIKRRSPVTAGDLARGVLIGIPNYFSIRFMLYSLAEVPATVAFPVNCIGGMMLMFLAGRFLFGEKLSSKKKLAVGIILVALVLLNLK
ncbi:MAG: EamA family transporter [Firmicutes bacterium]|nr:EamA family transporter [Bacillota bacterium]